MKKPPAEEIARLRMNPAEMLKVCQDCGGRCCTYVASQIDDPDDLEDFENIRWYCAHQGVWVFMDEEEDWYVAFDARCEHLQDDFKCGIYDKRPAVCRNHKFGDCDYFLDGQFEVELRSLEDVDAYLRQRFPKKFVKRPQRRKSEGSTA